MHFLRPLLIAAVTVAAISSSSESRAALAPYFDDFGSYLAGETPANFTSSGVWETSGRGSYGTSMTTNTRVYAWTKIDLTNVAGKNFTYTTTFGFSVYSSGPIADASTTFSLLSSPDGDYELTYYILSGHHYPSGTLTLGRSSTTTPATSSFDRQSLGPNSPGLYTLRVHGAYVQGHLFLEATVASSTDTASLYIIDDSPLAGSGFAISNAVNGSVWRLASFSMGLDDFEVKFEDGPPGQLVNLSTRAAVGTGDSVAIAGFIVTGNVPKRVLLRGVTPNRETGSPDLLDDPVLELHAADGTIIDANDDWKASQLREIVMTRAAPSDDRDAALVATLPPGVYTTVLHGKNGGTGIALVELYDLDRAADSRLANISTRGAVEGGDNVLIAGVIARGDTTRKVVIRALGPSLAAAGVEGVLPYPKLQLYDRNGTLVTENSSWLAGDAAELTDLGLAPTEDEEPALIAELLPTTYTAVVRGRKSTTGVALVEVYEVP